MTFFGMIFEVTYLIQSFLGSFLCLGVGKSRGIHQYLALGPTLFCIIFLVVGLFPGQGVAQEISRQKSREVSKDLSQDTKDPVKACTLLDTKDLDAQVVPDFFEA